MIVFDAWLCNYKARSSSDHPFIKKLNDHVVKEVAVKWKDLGFQLLNNESMQYTLEIIEADHKGKVSILPP